MHDPGVAVFLFLAIGALSLFAFLSVATWTGTRQQERESYYKAEMMKKIAEVGGERTRHSSICASRRESPRQNA